MCDETTFNYHLLRNSCLYTTSPTFSFPPTERPISPSMNSLLHRTNTKICPHSLPIPHSSERNPVPILDVSPYLTFLILIRFALPPVLRSAGLYFSSSYVFLFRFCSSSTFDMQHRPSAPFPLSTSYDSFFPLSYWFSDVVAYPEPYLELRLPPRPVLYKVTRPLVCSLASSTQFSLVSSLPRFALRTTVSKSSLTRNNSLRTL